MHESSLLHLSPQPYSTASYPTLHQYNTNNLHVLSSTSNIPFTNPLPCTHPHPYSFYTHSPHEPHSHLYSHCYPCNQRRSLLFSLSEKVPAPCIIYIQDMLDAYNKDPTIMTRMKIL